MRTVLLWPPHATPGVLGSPAGLGKLRSPQLGDGRGPWRWLFAGRIGALLIGLISLVAYDWSSLDGDARLVFVGLVVLGIGIVGRLGVARRLARLRAKLPASVSGRGYVSTLGSSADEENERFHFSRCMVGSVGGLKDALFNQVSWSALQSAQGGGIVTSTSNVAPDAVDDLESSVRDADCAVIVIVGLLLADKGDQTGEFVGNFEDTESAARLTRGMIRDEADVIFPVVGQLASTTAEVTRDRDGVAIAWPDSDGAALAPQRADVIITSIVERIDMAFTTMVIGGLFDAETFIGDLGNGGEDIAAFYEFDGDISEEINAELAHLQRAVIAGELSMTSPVVGE